MKYLYRTLLSVAAMLTVIALLGSCTDTDKTPETRADRIRNYEDYVARATKHLTECDANGGIYDIYHRGGGRGSTRHLYLECNNHMKLEIE